MFVTDTEKRRLEDSKLFTEVTDPQVLKVHNLLIFSL